MSLADKASLLLIPTGYKSQKVYSIFPTDGVGDFDFSRSSSATRIAKNGLITSVAANVPRLDYPLIDGVVSGCPSLLLEPSRTNLLTYSSGFVTDWNNTNITINSNSIISPDGSLNGTKFIPNTTSGQHYLDRNGVTVNSNASASIFAKKGEYKKFAIRSYFTGANAIFDVNEGIIISTSSVTAKIENYGNGWYRCSLNETLNANYGYGIFVMEDNSTNPLDTYVGNGVNGMYFYGASLEIGSFISSYIPTTTAAVTRAAETANGAGDASTFNDSEGVLMAEIAFDSNDGSFKIFGISDRTLDNRIVFYSNTDSNSIKVLTASSGVTQPILNVTVGDIKSYQKILVSYRLNYISFWVNGFEIATDLNTTTPTGLIELGFDNATNGNPFYGKTKQIQYYNSALTDSELEILTSWASFSEMAQAQQYSII